MTMTVQGVRVPSFLYGTAWKEDATPGLVTEALGAGFRGIDTANQRKHYFEEGVGQGLAAKFREGLVTRDEVFLQTKFTFQDGQDERLPYDPAAPIATQVAQSFERSLAHLGVTRLDSLILHGPSTSEGLGPDDHAAWRAMEALAVAGRVRLLGISNVTPRQVSELVAFSTVDVAFVQNRTYATRGWDRAVRDVCDEHGIVYQAFSLLTANKHVLANAEVKAIAARHRKSPAQVVFRFAQQVGMLPLTGTRDPLHMAADLAMHDLTLDIDELGVIAAGGA